MHKLLPIALLFLALTACKQSIPPNVSAMVNSRAITYAEVDKQHNLQFGQNASQEKPSEDEVMIQKLEILRSMIQEEIMLQRAEKLGLMATDADVDAKLNELRAPYTSEEFQKQLNAKKMTVDDLKTQIRRQLSVDKLFNKEITARISISDKDVQEYYAANKAAFNIPEPQVHLLQIVVTPRPDPNVRNLQNDKAQTDEQAQRKVSMLLSRAQKGEDFSTLAQNYSEDTSAGNGGDVGYVGESALDKISPDFKKLVWSLQPGQTSGILRMPDGYRLLKVLSKEPAGQRELNDPHVQQSIRETLLRRKDQLLRNAYYEVARNDAKVTNQLAATIVQNKDKK
jgi:peptidyl-prolyl cis-trans isomerase SurA